MLGQSLFVSYHISDVCFALGIVLTARLSICELLFLFTIALAFSMNCKLGLSVLIKGLSVVVQGHIGHSEGICDLFLAVFLRYYPLFDINSRCIISKAGLILSAQ